MEKGKRELLLQYFLQALAKADVETDENEQDEDQKEELPPSAIIDMLKKRKALLEEKSNFSVGDIIVWKEGLKNKRYPLYDQLCIVLSKHNPPKSNNDVDFNEQLDIEIGFVTENDEFISFNLDSKRFKLYKSK